MQSRFTSAVSLLYTSVVVMGFHNAELVEHRMPSLADHCTIIPAWADISQH